MDTAAKERITKSNEIHVGGSKKNDSTVVLEKAADLKEQGNSYFKKGDFKNAIKAYTSSLDYDPSNSVLPINRAMAYLKYAEAEADCTLGILLDKKNVKAHWRRGIARRSLGRLDESKHDFEAALVLDPSNKAVKEDLTKVKDLIAKSPKPTSPAPTSSKITAEKTVTKSPAAPQPQVVSSKRVPIKMVSNDEPTELFPATTTKTKPAASTSAVSENSVSTTKSTTTTATLSSATVALSSISLSMPMTAPTTTMELQRDWKSHSKDNSRLYQYLKLIKPESLPNIFKSSFESEYLTSMLTVFQDYYIHSEEPSLLYRMLENLAKVQRIDLSLMFMTGSEKKELATIFKHLSSHVENQDVYSQQDLVSLASKFKTSI
ncbi:hypothetical protein BGZ83_002852 [Gryganskiella cystojenkinii]|nr:hypothetical protein BGZ83_002852 [Gryganskiella cystojenkinii]